MLRKAEKAILFNPPRNVIEENSDLNVVKSYMELKESILRIIENEE